MPRVSRVLVANRDEIALRTIRACHEAGVEAAAVYSSTDDSQWVRFADSAIHIGGSSAHKSYLNMDAALEAAGETEADAVHPGYGFLSEDAEFARRIGDAGMVFIGPPSDVIERMGNKATARRTAEAAGVPGIPESGPLTDLDTTGHAAAEIGYPLLVKASAGGGRRGIRPVETPEQLAEVFATARAEAEVAFGDGTVYLERALPQARHIEVQVLADSHGNVVHVYERDCSVQRHRQKLIEEAPAPQIAPPTRSEICAAAARLAAHVGYQGAGTVEFLTEDGSFYFIKMNTRIQVEHPITECVTGVDLVAEQLRIARGEQLSISQDEISLKGGRSNFASPPKIRTMPSPRSPEN